MTTGTQGSRRGVRTDPAARRKIWELHRKQGLNAAQIYRKLEENGELGDKLPALRTIQHIVRQIAPPAEDEWVAVVDGQLSEDAAYVLFALGWVMSFTDGQVQAFSASEARWISSLHRVLDWHPVSIWDLASGMITIEKERPALVAPVLAWLRHHHRSDSPRQVELDEAAAQYDWPRSDVQILPPDVSWAPPKVLEKLTGKSLEWPPKSPEERMEGHDEAQG